MPRGRPPHACLGHAAHDGGMSEQTQPRPPGDPHRARLDGRRGGAGRRPVGRPDRPGRRELPHLGPAGARRRDPRPGPAQGGRGRGQRRARGARRAPWPPPSPRPPREVADGRHDDQFPIDVFQTGSGTSHQHERQRGRRPDRPPRDRRRRSTPTTTSTPASPATTPSRARCGSPPPWPCTATSRPACCTSPTALRAKETEFADVVKAGRTHLMDAVPVTLGQEFGGYARQVELGAERVLVGRAGDGRAAAGRHRRRHRPQRRTRASPRPSSSGSASAPGWPSARRPTTSRRSPPRTPSSS